MSYGRRPLLPLLIKVPAALILMAIFAYRNCSFFPFVCVPDSEASLHSPRWEQHAVD